MINNLLNGIWPTMMVPMHEDASIDYEATERLLNWYHESGAHGIFSLCYSSEIRMMTLEERISLMRFIAGHLPKGMQLTASAHVADEIDDQIEEFKKIIDAGAPHLVLIANRLAKEEESDDMLIRNAEKILNAFPDMDFGLYECPFPYRRLLSSETLGRLAKTNRFTFMKDTCCNTPLILEKLKAVEGTRLKIYNANAATLWDTWKAGCAGFSGVMCNFHTDLYVRMWQAFEEKDEELGQWLQTVLGMFSSIERMNYPVNAKAYQMKNLGMTAISRQKSVNDMRYSFYKELEYLHTCEDWVREKVRAYDAK